MINLIQLLNYYFFLYNLESFIMNLFQKFKTLGSSLWLRAQFFYQNKLFKPKYLALGFIGFNIPIILYYSYQYPEQVTLVASKATENLSQIQIPISARNFVYGTYSKIYGVNQEEMLKPFQQYKTFSQFFTRKIKQRKINKQQNAIISPSDSLILSCGQIKQNSVFVVKGYSYNLAHLFTGQDIQFSAEDIQSIKKNKQNKLYHVVLYLSPGDYHRFHSATNFEVMRRKSIEGTLFSVKQKNLISRNKVYQQNSRLILHGKWKQGYLGMVLVGALNTGRIIVKDKLQFQTGQQIGYFNLGSSIVLIIQSANFEWNVQKGQKIKYGQVLGRYKNIQNIQKK